jgi:hypothetical protein
MSDDGFSNDDEVFYSTTNYDTKASGFVDREGVYQLAIVEWEKKKLTSGHTVAEFSLEVQASVPGQSPAGSKLRHTLWLTDGVGHAPEERNVQSALNFLVGCGVMQRKLVDGKEVAVCTHDDSDKVTPKVLAMACNRVVWGPVKSWTNKKGQTQYELQFGRCYQLDDPKYCRLPGDDASAEIAGFVRVNGAYQKKGGEPARQPVATAAAKSEFSDI